MKLTILKEVKTKKNGLARQYEYYFKLFQERQCFITNINKEGMLSRK